MMPHKIDISMPIALLDEYITYRQKTWNSTTDRAATLARDTGKVIQYAGKSMLSMLYSSSSTSSTNTSEDESVKNRPAICAALKNRLKNIKSFEDCIVIINEMADQARKAKTQTTVAEESEFSYTLHAARTYFINQLLSSTYSEEFRAHIDSLKQTIATLKQQIENLKVKRKLDFEQGRSIQDTQDEILSIKAKILKPFQELLNLQDKDTIYNAAIKNFFISHKIGLPSKDNLLIPFTINYNVPLIYHPDYYNMYYAVRIAPNGGRKEGFAIVLATPIADEKGIDLANPVFNHQLSNPVSGMLTSHIDLTKLARAGQAPTTTQNINIEAEAAKASSSDAGIFSANSAAPAAPPLPAENNPAAAVPEIDAAQSSKPKGKGKN